MKDKTQYTHTNREKKKIEEGNKKDKTQYTLTNREKRKRRRIKHNTHLQIERREKEEG